MAEHVITLPDVGEGVAEAEIAELLVKVGDSVREDQPLAAVLTDKATVEIPSPVAGTVAWIGYEAGAIAAVGSALIRIETAGDAPPAPHGPAQASATGAVPPVEPALPPAAGRSAASPPSARALAAPAVRAFARERSVDLAAIRGSGPEGRVLRGDVVAHLAAREAAAPATDAADRVEPIRIAGIRRVIAERLQETVRRIPHFTYVEEVDVTELEALRAELNRVAGQPRLTVLPFLMRALVLALADFPQLNARFDEASGTLLRYGAVHLGIATQTPAGLLVPVVRHAERRTVRDCGAEVARLAAAARAGTARREELAGSTLTVTSLGALGGLATTPIINAPEVAIIGVNRIDIRQAWRGEAFVPRSLMNLSSSFDHRFIDGWEAAAFIQALRTLLENPLRILA
jgi:2-oxoisovalerate dehydrogenase E2 component (dihydrolipoyl transacylase)